MFLGISTENLPAQFPQRYEPDLEHVTSSTCSYIFHVLNNSLFPQHHLKSFQPSYLKIAPGIMKVEFNSGILQQRAKGRREANTEKASHNPLKKTKPTDVHMF